MKWYNEIKLLILLMEKNMIKVNCKIFIEKEKINGAEKIISYVQGIYKKEIEYKDSSLVSQQNNSTQKLNIKQGNIKEDKENNIYFICNETGKILYVGKSLNINYRIKQHLLSCSKSTGSKIENVSELLKKYEAEKKELKIYYCSIKVEPKQFYGTIEGMLISYFTDNKNKGGEWNIKMG